jgi:hypothetical protein
VDNSGARVTEIFPEERGNSLIQMMAWEWLPLQASWIESHAFFAVDGFASLPSLLGGFEDVHLSRQIALHYDMACTDHLVASIRIGDVGSTTNYVTMFDQNRQSREKILENSSAFRRMIASARAHPGRSAYWYGRTIYFYLASLKWNLQRRHLTTATSRGARVLVGFTLAGADLFSGEFWHGVVRPHYPRMGLALQQSGADRLYANTRRAMEKSGEKKNSKQ